MHKKRKLTPQEELQALRESGAMLKEFNGLLRELNEAILKRKILTKLKKK